MKKIPYSQTRRSFLSKSATGATAASILPRHILGAPHVPPSEKFGTALIGCGGRGPGTYSQLCKGLDVELVGACDVDTNKAKRFSLARSKGKAESYQDFRRLLERKDLDLVAIATPPHWHASISIAAAEAGMDVLCEKPMTRFVAEGRAVVNAFKRYGRIYQIGTFGRFNRSKDKASILKHKIMSSGLMKDCNAVRMKKGGLKVKQWSGTPGIGPQTIPDTLDWDLYCGPSPWKPYESRRTGGTHRGYWDYEGGGMCDMGQHHFDPEQWTYAKDHTSPVEITPFAPPSHPEVTGMWAWVELKYADGFKFVMESGEWGPSYERHPVRDVSLDDLSKDDQEKIKSMPDPEPLLSFGEAVKQRKQAGGHPEAAHRAACILHLANLAIRLGRKLKYDPDKEVFINDNEANRFLNPPMSAPWRI